MLESILFSALIVERLTEWVFGTLFDRVERLKPYRWALMYCAAALGIVAAFSYSLDLFALAGQPASVFGKVLTGVAIGGGANLIHDLTPGDGGVR